MDPNIDDELKEYLRLIDATVKSASTNHNSPQKLMIPQSQLLSQLKTNDFFSGITLINNCDAKEIKNHTIQRKKPQILDDSISDWNIGSQQTTLESPKSQEDIKELCGTICGGNMTSYGMTGQFFSSVNNGHISQSASSKPQRYFQEQQRDELQSCLCSLDKSQKQSRNIVVQLGQEDEIDQFITFARSFGDLQNIDRHKYQYEKIIILSFYNLTSSIQAFQQISNGSNMIKISYINDFNDFDFIDYMLIQNANSFNQKLVFDYLGCFGKIMEHSNIDSKLVIRYFDVRSLKEIDRLIKLQEKDKKSFIYLHRSHFPEVEEKFILELLKNIFIFSKENTTDIVLKNTRVKNNKGSSTQQPIQSSLNQRVYQTDSTQLNQYPQQLTNFNITTEDASSPSIPISKLCQQPSSKQDPSNVLSNFFNFDENSNTLPLIRSQSENNTYPTFLAQQRGMNQSFNPQSLQYSQSQQLSTQGSQFSQQQQCLQQQLSYQQPRKELQEICDFQNCYTPQQVIGNYNSQNTFMSPHSSNNLSSINENCIPNEIENVPLNPKIQQQQQQQQQQHQQKNQKRLNINGSSFNTMINFGNQNSYNGISMKNNTINNSINNNNSNNTNNNINCQGSMNSLQQSFSNMNISNDNGQQSQQQQMQFLQQVSQSSSSSLTSNNYPLYNGGHMSNYNSMRMSQDDNPFSASSLRMSFDNNPIFQVNPHLVNNNCNLIKNNNNNNNSNNNNSINNLNNNNNSNNNNSNNINNDNNNIYHSNISFNNNNNNQNSAFVNKQLRQQNQQSQFMNLLNCNNSYMSEMRFGGNNNIAIDQDTKYVLQNYNFNNQNSTNNNNKQLNNDNFNFSNSQLSSNNIGTIIGSNSTKSHITNQNFQVSLENITQLKDRRATIMVRNIPNRYNQEDFLRIVDINFKGLYDFVYLPMDFKNHCNIGYAFINFIDPKHIIPFYKEFNNKRWEMIRSEKVCYICYARIQGRNELIAHFKKSGVMSAMVDKSFKPLILPNPYLDLQMTQY